MYSLILTLAMVYYSGTAATIEHIDGFTSEAACLKAGNAWLEQMKKASVNYNTSTARAMCVQK